MHDRVEWLKPSDHVILQEYRKYGGWMKASSVRLNVNFSGQHVQRRSKALAEHGLLERHESEPAYRITDLGVDLLLGKLTPEDLQD